MTGNDHFQKILKQYISTYRLLSVKYQDFQNIYNNYVKQNLPNPDDIIKKANWDVWLFQPGFPVETIDFTNKWLIEAQGYVDKLFNNTLTEDFVQVFNNWHTNVKLAFFNYIVENMDKVTVDHYKFLQILKLNGYNNAEVAFVWYDLGLKLNQTDVIEYVVTFLGEVGRMKFIRPLYISLYNVDKQKALDTLESNKDFYNSIAYRLIQKDLHIGSNFYLE